jgi:hypothetical protein
MGWVDWVQLGAIVVGSIAALGGVVGLAMQLAGLRSSFESQVYQRLIENAFRIDELMISRPALRKYIYDHAPIPQTDFDPDEFESIIELIVDFVDNVRVQERFIPKAALPGWRATMNEILDQPAVVDFMTRRRHWYHGTLTSPERRQRDNAVAK